MLDKWLAAALAHTLDGHTRKIQHTSPDKREVDESVAQWLEHLCNLGAVIKVTLV